MDRYLNVTEARRELLDLVEHLHGADRVVITKRGQPRAVLVNCERYELLEDVAWVLQDPGRRAATRLGRSAARTNYSPRPSDSSDDCFATYPYEIDLFVTLSHLSAEHIKIWIFGCHG